MPDGVLPSEAEELVRRLAALPERKRRNIERVLLRRAGSDARMLELLRRYSNGELTGAELDDALQETG
ncbi:MAG: hypothetical protein GWN84_21655 [Gammaproteobacteria bacterium]|nr:hypothetical protein [Gammaproteobacteria bacterium]NIR85327.1 hypothetical protein [Gammaproteobacteria bacterium]NIR88443.1 hypothetical protein [Gammaproteobacteria bacterium]NIU06393.1 hypothetical protein [Gammaproteobacteria bacterium]NIV53292.1 hypothetical protein [Gammaproteobacteria bacterium]